MSVSFGQIPSDLRVPLFYAEMDNSAANSASEILKTLLVGQLLATGTAVPAVPVLVSSNSQADALFGVGSMLTRMYARYRVTDPFGEVWCLPVAGPGAGAAAVGKITLSGAATGAGTLSVYVAGQRVQAAVVAGDEASAVAATLAAAIMATPTLPATAVATGADVVLTARHAGLLGNDITLVLNYRGESGGEMLPAGLQVAITVMAGGSGVVDLEPAIAAMGDELFDFIGQPYTDSGSLDAWRQEMDDTSGRWSWLRQIYGHVYSARRGTLGEQVAFGRARNDGHMTIADVERGQPLPVWEAAAAYVARNAVFIRADPARPTQTGELGGILPSPRGQRRTISERQSLLSAGIATTYTESGVVRVERAITTYQRNAWGQPDNSYFDSETLHTSAYVLRALKTRITSKYGRHKLASDGTKFGAGQAMVTPKVIRAELIAVYSELEEKGIVENGELFRKYLVVERDTDSNRVNVLFPPDYVNQLRVFAVLNQFRLQYPATA